MKLELKWPNCVVLVVCVALVPTVSFAQTCPSDVLWDDFQSGFPGSKWTYFAFPTSSGGFFVGDDAVETTSASGLVARSSGTNALTGEPAFVKTVGQEGASDNPGVPGGLDHVKWLVYMAAFSGSSPGFEAVAGCSLTYQATVGGESFGTDGHPFPRGFVKQPDDDLRLGSVAMNTIDLETFMVFDFFLTNEGIYAFYERLPFARAFLGNYAAFSYQIRVGDREPSDMHDLQISYDPDAGVIRWLLEDEEVFRVDAIGQRLPGVAAVIDHGGEEPAQPLELNQLWAGMGMFTLLDASYGPKKGLVRLSTEEDFYFDSSKAWPKELRFLDNASNPPSRLFGQGAEIRVGEYRVKYEPND